MISIDINENSFSGDLPSEIGLLTALSVLRMKSNNFSGEIPSEVCALWDASLVALGGGDTNFGCLLYGGLTCPTPECCPVIFCP